MDMYGKLPVFEGPNMFPEPKMKHFRDNIRPNMQFCGLAIVPKLKPWCDYIRDFDRKAKLYGNSSHSINNTVISNNITSIVNDINDAGCYDSYNCDVPSFSGIIHSLMVAMAIFSLIGFFLNIYCLIKMHLKHNKSFIRNYFGIYIATIIVMDCIHIILSWLLFIGPTISGYQYKDHIRIYSKYTFLLVPYLLPFWDLTSLIVTWLAIALLIQRSNLTRQKMLMEAKGFESLHCMNAEERRKTYFRLSMIVFGLLLFIIPKFAEYTFNYDYRTNNGIVVPLLRIIKLYRVLMLKFIYPSVECVIPIVMMFTYIAVIKYHETILTKFRERKISNNQDNNTPTDNLINPNAKVFSVAGVSKKTQLVIWVSTIILFNLIMKLAAVFVSLERTLEGSPKEQWPRLRQIIKYIAIIFSIVAVSVKPLIYIHSCPRLLRKDLSATYFNTKNDSENF